MRELYQSDLLQALGWAIADSLWQMSLIWLIYQLFFALPFRQKPAIKHLAAVLSLIMGTLWFFYSFSNRFSEEQNNLKSLSISSSEIPISFTNILNSTLPYFSTAYLLILVLLMARLIYNIAATQKLKMELTPSIEWQHVVNRLTVSMGISKEIFIYISEHISVPSTIGYLKPIILLPVATVNQLSVEQLEAVIIHEMAHIRRNDYLINLAVAFIETVLFFNPFVHLLCRVIRKECELCCDDAVVRQQDPESYAQALLLLEQSKLQPRLAMAATGKQGMLLGRIKRILNVPDKDVKYKHKVLALVMLAGLIMLTGLLTPQKTSEQDREKTSIARQQLFDKELERVPLPYAISVSEPEKPKQRVKDRTIAKPAKSKPSSIKTIKQAVAMANEFDFNFTVDAPLPPTAPAAPTPPVHEYYKNDSYFQIPWNAYEDQVKGTSAPDPRDRRSEDILRTDNNRQRIAMADFRKAQAAAGTQKMFRTNEKSAKQLEELTKIDDALSKVRLNQEQLHYQKAIENMAEKAIIAEGHYFQPDGQVYTPRVNVERKKSPVPQKKSTKLVKTIPVEKGMTITIIQDEEQIEITLKDQR